MFTAALPIIDFTGISLTLTSPIAEDSMNINSSSQKVLRQSTTKKKIKCVGLLFEILSRKIKQWDTCAVVAVTMETMFALAFVRSFRVYTSRILATLVTFFIAFINI